MVTKSDITILLNDLQEKGIDINGYLKELYSTSSILLNIIKHAFSRTNLVKHFKHLKKQPKQSTMITKFSTAPT